MNLTADIWLIKVIAGALGLCCISIEDILKKEISTGYVLAFGVLGIFLSAAGGEWQDLRILCRFLPGILCLGLGRISRESIGYGDGLVIFCLGGYLTLYQLLGVCFAAITIAGISALVLLAVVRVGRKTRMPFVPFLLAAYGIILLCDGGVQV